MGARKRLRAEEFKVAKKKIVGAALRNCPSSPRKMRLVVDMIRGVEVNKALGILKFSKKHASVDLEKLIKSAIANWEIKNQADKCDLEEGQVFIKEISVDGGRMLKRISPAPQGRAYRIRKRSNHINVVLGNKKEKTEETVIEKVA
ncbi:MAG: 50S ribosomal protein L22 [Bacteroidales bacterium]